MAGIRSKRKPMAPLLALTRSKSTLKTWSGEVLSPVKTVVPSWLTAVPVAGRGLPSTRA